MKTVSYIYDIYELSEYLSRSAYDHEYKLFIFEGFDGVGKSSIIKSLTNFKYGIRDKSNRTYILDVFNFDWSNTEPDPNLRYKHGPMLIRTLKTLDYPYDTTGSVNRIGLVDRWLFSSIVYDKFYNNYKLETEISKSIDYSFSLKANFKICPILVEVEKNDLKELFRKSQSRKDNEPYDEFDDFEEYYDSYLQFTEEYREVLRKYSEIYKFDYIIYKNKL